MVIDEPRKAVELHLENGAIHSFEPPTPESYEKQRFARAELPLPFEQFFPQLTLTKGDREMTLGELSERIRELGPAGKRLEAARFQVEWHKKFAIPAACLIFGLLGLGLSLGSRKEARSAAFGLSIAVIFMYYVIIRLGEQAGDTGLMPAWLAMWGANLNLGGLGASLLALNQRAAAFDPLDPTHYTGFLPRVRRGIPQAPAQAHSREPPAPAGPHGRPLVAIRHGLPVNVVYRSANNPWADRLFLAGRRDIVGGLIPKGAEGARLMLKALQAGKPLGMLVDQKMNHGIPIPFFGRDAMTAPALAQLALKFDCTVLPFWVQRVGGAHFRATIEPPLTLPSTGDRHADIRTVMTMINARTEAWIRQCPGQWLWLHRRWPD